MGIMFSLPLHAELQMKQVAVVIFPQDKVAKRYVNSAQTRLESILADNGVTILDQKKAASLKNVWKKLEDPGYFITAEDFVKNAGKYEIDGVMRVYLRAESTKTVGQFFSATALADMRLVDEEAQIKSFVTVPMGVPGRPPSDGLTESSAIANAVQRAIDEAAGNVGLQVMDYTNPKLLKFNLDGPHPYNEAGKLEIARSTSTEAVNFANMKHTGWVEETVSCQDADRSGNFSVIGGYVFSKKFGRFNYWSELHLVDVKNGKEVLTFGPLQKEVSQRGTSKVIDCMFVKNWRYVVALTENQLFMWDTERNVVVSSTTLEARIPDGRLAYLDNRADGDWIVINSEGSNTGFKLVRE